MIRKVYYIISRDFRSKVLFLFLSIVIGMFLEVFGISILLPVLSAILKPEKLLLNPFFSPIFDFLKITNTEQLVQIFLTGLLIVYIVKGVFLLLINYIRSRF